MVLLLERRRGGMVFSSRGVGVVWFSSSRDVGGGMVLFLERCTVNFLDTLLSGAPLGWYG